MNFSDAHLNRFPDRTPTPNVKSQPIEPEYDPRLDEEVTCMFGRRHGELETFTPLASRAYHALVYGAILGGGPETPNDIPLLQSIARNTRHPKLRGYACSSLRSYLRDSEQEDATLKNEIRQTLEQFGESLAPRPVQKMDKSS
jgi:hypothetical protein